MPRFTTQDPLAEAHYDESPYVYCGNDPVNKVDPLGLDWYYNDPNEFPTYIEGNKDNKNYKYHSKTAYRESANLRYYFGEAGSIMIVEKVTGDAMTYLPQTVVKPSGGYTNYNSYSYGSLNEMMGEGGRGSALLNKPDNWVNGIGVGLSAVSLSTGNALERTMAYHGGVSTIKPQQVMFKLPVGEAYVPTKVVNAISNSATHIGYGLAGVSAALTIADAVDKREWQNHHTADLAVNAGLTYLSIACPVAGLVVGGLYFVGDLASQYYTGRSITENVFDR